MGAASINISELETLLDNIDTVDATLSQAETDIKNARDNTKSYSYQVPQMVPCTVGPHGRPSYQLCHRVEWYHPPHPHLTSFDLTAWNNWRDTWSPFYHRALGYGIDLLQISGAFGPGDDIPCGPDLDAQIAAGTPALTPKEIPVVGAQIGVKIAKGNRLTVDEWLYWNRYAELPDFANAIMANCTVAQLARAGSDQAMTYGPAIAGIDLANLSDADKANLKAYDDHLGPMGRSLAVWASEPVNQEKAISSIEAVLRDQNYPLSQAAMTILLGYGVYATPVAVQIADDMYGVSTSGDGAMIISNDIHIVDQNGCPVYDSMTGVMAMLGNSPDASIEFFTSGQSTYLSIPGEPPVPVNDRITWALGYGWPDAGIGVGKALFVASVPAPGSDVLRWGKQATVASQLISGLADAYVADPLRYGFGHDVGLLRGVASVMAAYGVDCIEITQGQGSHSNYGFGDQPAPGGETVVGLGVSKNMYGWALQAVGSDIFAAEIVVSGWANSLPAYYEKYIGTAGGTDADNFVFDPSDLTNHDAPTWPLRNSAKSLDFICDNLAASWLPDQKTDREAVLADVVTTGVGASLGFIFWPLALMWDGAVLASNLYTILHPPPDGQGDISALTQAAAATASQIWLGVVIRKGYISPEAIAAHNASGLNPIPDPFTPDTGWVTAPVIIEDDTGRWSLNHDSPATEIWLNITKFVNEANQVVYGTKVGGANSGTDDLEESVDQLVQLPQK